MYAEKHGMQLEETLVTIELDNADPAEAVFRERVELRGRLTAAETKRLLEIAGRCSVQKTLSKRIRFEPMESHGSPLQGENP